MKSDARLILLLLLFVTSLVSCTAAAELRAERDQDYLNLCWDAANAKLQQALTLSGPWQTVNTAAVTSCRIRMTGTGKFYRLTEPAPGKKWLTVAAVTMTSTTNTAANLQTFYSYMEQAATNGVDLIVFPEVALQGCPPWAEYPRTPAPAEMAYVRETAETVPGPSTSNLVARANALNIFVAFGMTEKDAAGKLYNSAVFLGPGGVLGTHRKSIQVGNDALIWTRGTNLIEVFDSPIGKAGMMICAEMGGESASEATVPGPRLAAAGANLLVTVSAWWTSIADLWDLATTLNASRADRWHVVSEQVGMIGYAQTYGHSRVVDPLGCIVSDGGQTQGMVVWATDQVTDIRDP